MNPRPSHEIDNPSLSHLPPPHPAHVAQTCCLPSHRLAACEPPTWFCLRTHPKHEHIAAAGLRQELGLEIFLPRISVRRATVRGVVRFTEALFPCYLFARFALSDRLQAVRHARGVSQVVHFGSRWPTLPDATIQELQALVDAAESEALCPVFHPGQAVRFAGGVFHGLNAVVLRALPGRERVAVLLDFLGQQTSVEVRTNEVIKVSS